MRIGRDWLFCVAAVCAVAFLPVCARAADDAAALLAKHAAYAGWTGGDGTIRTLRETGAATRDGKTVAVLRRLQSGQIYRESATHSGGVFDRGFTGRVFWQSNVNGFTTRTVGDAVKALATDIEVANEELTRFPATVRGHETIDGVSTTIVRVTPDAGLPVDVYIDPQSGAYKRLTIDPDGKYEQDVDVLADTDVVGGKTTYAYTNIEINTEISADELHPPPAVATWTFGPAAQSTPIVVQDRQILLDATVNGHPGRFLFDTGASETVLTDSFARLVGAKPRGHSYVSGIGGGIRANVYRVETLAIGPNTLHDLTVATGLEEREQREEHIDGLIGFDLLAGAIVDLDLDASTVRLYDPASMAPDHTQGITLRIDLSGGSPAVAMIAGGRIPVNAIIDSGDSFFVAFSSQLVSRGRLKFFSRPDSLANELQFVGVNGHETDACGSLESLELGPISYRPVPACMSASMSNNDVLVGFDFFKAFNYVFDYPDGEILLSPRKNH